MELALKNLVSIFVTSCSANPLAFRIDFSFCDSKCLAPDKFSISCSFILSSLSRSVASFFSCVPTTKCVNDKFAVILSRNYTNTQGTDVFIFHAIFSSN